MNKVIFLYSELGPYMTSFLEQISTKFDITCVHWNRKLLRPNQVYSSKRNLKYIPKDSFSLEVNENFDLVYVSGWMDLDYLLYARKLKHRGAKIIVGFDDRWLGTIKQHLCVLPFKLIRRLFFDYAWVAGYEQWHYARRLGFKAFEIRTHLLTSNIKIMDGTGRYNPDGFFLYVGTISRKKGVDLLIKAYKKYRENGGLRKLIICGPNTEDIIIPKFIIYDGFLTSAELNARYQAASCLILPSRSEQWGAVINEAMSFKLPIILSNVVGSIGSLAIPNLNSLIARPTVRSLGRRLIEFDRLEREKKQRMSHESENIIGGFSREKAVSQFKSFLVHDSD